LEGDAIKSITASYRKSRLGVGREIAREFPVRPKPSLDDFAKLIRPPDERRTL
jgi:hypothetical protein